MPTQTVPTKTVPTRAVRDPASRPPFLASGMPDDPVQVMSWNCSTLGEVEPHGLGLTYWFDTAPTGDPYSVSIRLTGHRVVGGQRAQDQQPGTFQTVRTIDRILPGSGPVAVTWRVSGIAPGQWEVTAEPVVARDAHGVPAARPPGHLPTGSAVGTTAFLPVVNVRAPGVRIGAWPALVGGGWVLALALQWFLGSVQGLPVGRQLMVTLIASLVGLAGAKAYYLITHLEQRGSVLRAGMSVQGFVIAAIAVLLLGGWLAAVPVGPMLDATAPGLLFALMIGRLGCFFGGCCVGRPTGARWGVWSSDRAIGVRRIPVQLMESAVAGFVAAGTTLAVVLVQTQITGLLFLAGFSAYTFGRQVLFPLRGIPRKTRHGRTATMIVSGLVLVGSVIVLART